MKNRFILGTALAAAVLFLPFAGVAKTYSVESIRIEADVMPDGLMRVSEHIAFDFNGRFSYAYRDIPLRQGDELSEISVGESGRRYTLATGDDPNTYWVSRSGARTRITWHYAASGGPRTFDISYITSGGVRRFPDVVEIYYKFVGEETEVPINGVDVLVRLPRSVDSDAVRAWAHGPLNGVVAILDSAAVSLSVSPLPAGEFWEARILCPSGAFESLPLASGEPRLARILSEEVAWAEEANRQRLRIAARAEADASKRLLRAKRKIQLMPFALLLTVAAAGIWLQFFFRHGRPYPVVSRVAPGDLPSAHPPAAVSYLLYRSVSGPAVAATLLDLASRGYLEIRENVTTAKSLFGKEKTRMDYRFDVLAKSATEVQPFERDLLQFVLQNAGDSTGFSVLSLRKAASRKRRAFTRFFRKWSRQIGENCRTLRLYEPYPVGAMVANGVTGAAIMGAGLLIIAGTNSWIGAPPMLAGALEAVFTVFLTRRTVEGQRLAAAWKAFRSHLKSVSRAMRPVGLASPEWGRYVIAAVLFGIHKKVLPNLRLEDGRSGGPHPVWFHGSMGAGGDGGSPDFASGLSSMVEAVSKTSSSAAGAGGGASAGGGGRAGGGGVGAG
jgi:uncharacterized membrane protein